MNEADVRCNEGAAELLIGPSLAVFLYDKTGNMARPWLDAGFICLTVDLQHAPPLATNDGRLFTLGADLRHGFRLPEGLPPFDRIAFVAAFPPCDHLAVSGARWFKGKGLRKLALAVDLFATAADFCEASGAPYLIENPVSTISTYWRKPDHTFQPWYFTGREPGDNYNKTTCLWTGNGFVMPSEERDIFLDEPDDRIHRASPSADRANIRSATPMGFARAVFEANCRVQDPLFA